MTSCGSHGEENIFSHFYNSPVPNDNLSLFIELITDYGEKINFLVDTGATLSTIKESKLNAFSRVNFSNIYNVNGISGNLKTLGTINLNLYCQNFLETFLHNFHVLPNITNLKSDGIIGSDFLNKFQADILYNSMKLILRCKSRVYEIPFLSSQNSYDFDFSQQLYNITYLNQNTVQINSPNRIQELLTLLNYDNLDYTERTHVENICSKFNDIFKLPNDKLSVSNLGEQKIFLKPNTPPQFIKQYRIPFAYRQEINKQIEQMMNENKIENSLSPWNSPLLVVPKKSVDKAKPEYRIVVDYRNLNKYLEEDKFPLPNINDILDNLGNARYFTCLDLSQGYYQLSLSPDDREYTAFSTDSGHFHMTRLPMGLKTSPAIFSRAMSTALSG